MEDHARPEPEPPAEELLRRALVDADTGAAIALQVRGLPVSETVTVIFHGRRDMATLQTYVTSGGRGAGAAVRASELLRVPCDLDLADAEDRTEAERLYAEQATALLSKLKASGGGTPTITMINGAPTDNNAKLFKQGALSVFNSNGVKIGQQYDTPDWSPDKAQNEMQQAITALGKNGFTGVYAANDGTAGGAIAAMTSAGIQPATRPTTGQDAELAAVQRILAGQQYMTVYKAVVQEAPDAATIAVALAKGQKPPTPPINGTTNNGQKNVPSTILTPVAVTKTNIGSTIVKDKFWTAAQICTGQYAAACKTYGIS